MSYGSSKISFTLPTDNILGVLKAKTPAGIENIEYKIKDVLQNPINSLPLKEIIKPKEKVAIVVSDITRTTGQRIFLPELLEELKDIGISYQDITVIIANGTHRLHTEDEKREKVIGNKTFSQVKVFDHNCKDEDSLIYIGKTSRGTEVYLNRYAVEADRLILTGCIVYHYYAGFGGGRKSIVPGVAGYNTIQQNHSLVLHPAGGRNHNAIRGKLHGNPIHEDMMEAAKMVKIDFLLNTVLNEKKQIAAIFGGDWYEAHIRGCEYVKETCGVKIKEKADLVITSCGGAPFDINFYQAHKAIDNTASSVKEGGVMILIAECSQGIGSDEFYRWFDYPDLFKMEEELRKNFQVVGHTAYSTREKANRIRIIMVSRLPASEVLKLGIIPAKDVKDAINYALDLVGNSPTIYVVPEGYVTVPVEV